MQSLFLYCIKNCALICCSHEFRYRSEEVRARRVRAWLSSSGLCPLPRPCWTSFPRQAAHGWILCPATKVPGFSQWLWFFWNYPTEGIPLNDCESLKTYFVPGIPWNGRPCQMDSWKYAFSRRWIRINSYRPGGRSLCRPSSKGGT